MALITLFSISAIIIYTLTVINCDLSTGSETSVLESFPKEKCDSLLTNCTCENYVEAYGIICNGMNNFPNFTSLLASDIIFEKKVKYEITLSGIQYLPAKSLDGLVVYRLFLNDPNLSSIDQDVFEGVLRLEKFHVRHSKIEEIPDFRVIRDSIRSINIDNSKLTTLDGEGLRDLPNVTRLSFVNNAIEYIDSDVFKGTDAVIIFDVSHNLLMNLTSNLINTWKDLKKFDVSYNRLLNVNQVFAVNHPQFIYLDFNNLTDVDSILYPNMDRVETLSLASNPIRRTSENSFKFKIPNVRFLYLDHCQIREFNVSHFTNLNILATLDLSFNEIEVIESQEINIGRSLELDLIGNQIRRFDGEIKFNIKRMWLNENKLQFLGRTLQYTQIVEVSVARNQLQYLSAEDFRSVHATANLELQNNQIRWIDRRTFESIHNDLHYLDLSVNFIPSLNGSIKTLSQLKALNISDNRIETFEEEEFKGLNELSELYLQNNHIKDLGGQLQLLSHLQYLVIISNDIHNLEREQIPEELKYLYIADNPLKCSCRLVPFLLWLNTSGSPDTDIELCPPAIEEYRENINATCPKMCSCACAVDGKDFFMSVNCSSKNLTVVPPFLTADFDQIQEPSPITFDSHRTLTFDQNKNPNFHINDRVLGIDLGNNSLDSLQSAQLPVDLINLYLSNNRLKTLPLPMFHSLKSLRNVSLSGNPWDCDCKAIGFKQWLLSRLDIVQDVNQTRCGITEKNESGLDGNLIANLTDLDLCPTDIGMYVSIAFGLLVFLLLGLAFKILYTRYERDIKVYLYSHGVTWVKERDIDHDKSYDAFIAFSHEDTEFVKELVKVIEIKGPNIRLFIHTRDFKAGEYIGDNIEYAVKSSKRTILLLSKNFFNSPWCQEEFKAAHVQALKDKLHRIIIIKMDEFPEEIDPEIKEYLKHTTYLSWGEKHFWDNLLYVLPTSSTPRNPEPKYCNIERKLITNGPKINV